MLYNNKIRIYLSLERITALCVHSLIGYHIEESIVHITTLATMITIGNCKVECTNQFHS